MRAKTIWSQFGVIFLTLGLLSACDNQSSGDVVVVGDANYRERIALPENAVFEATIVDITDATKEADVISRFEKKNPGQPPFAYRLTYDNGDLKPNRQYILRARVLQDDKVIFATQDNYQLTAGKAPAATSLRLIKVNDPVTAADRRDQLSRDVDRAEQVIAEKTQEMSNDLKSAGSRFADATRETAANIADKTKEVGAAAAAATKEVAGDISSGARTLADDMKNSEIVQDTKEAVKGLGNRNLEETYWRLSSIPAITFNSQDLEQDAHVILHKTNTHLAGSDGCNSITGTYSLADNNQVKFTKVTSSNKTCEKGINIAGALSAALTGTTHYSILGNTLELKNAAGTTLAKFTAVDL